uniref:Uncharacterized protein n=1 Tax=Anopheles triannulatus TaxID=58253 RepID=A0A2M4AVP1_9DIPT
MCPQAVAVPDSKRISSSGCGNSSGSNISNICRRDQQVASTKLLRKRLCIHPTTMFRIASKISNGLRVERSPKMVKYSVHGSRCCFTASPLTHH